MDERIETKAPPVYVATTSPAHIPGITAPSPGPAEKDGDATTGGTPDDAAPAEDAAPEDAAPEEQAAEPEPEPRAEAAEGAGEEATEPEGSEAPADGPVFEAADRRAAVRADADGIRLRLDDQEAEFTWEEVAAVESSVSRFGRRLLVAVHTPGPWRYPAEVEADGKEQAKEWLTALDAVLDAYFEE
ncbi:hypothetical protein KQH42_04695 [Streptomyces sp. CHA1]|uniref:hypothetical protein n=1 Tax=Streptomyces TaxID=1883 RepID=UPI0013971149|nr:MULTISPECIES: hypothetical protein [unclassified Streptomyces]QOZ98678.1 hypothetical protein DI273_05355 [Streptomyces violascens]WDV30950.1 hypothetical protein OIM90_05000 [Streptomyces sp. AD16]WSB23216.1 hypothetical protein OHB02_24935 [Streptomyces albidoflavus]MBP3076745.1 hypothetical protein [Streptomyces sp. 604F]MBT3159279.1 hypothetical protein [Streptomyces sp. G11C]